MSRDGRFSDQASVWASYRSEVRDGDFEKALKTWKALYASFPDDSTRKDFFKSVLSDANRRLVRVVQVCDACTMGKCAACGGNGRCPECKGSLKCGLCGGRKQLIEGCQHCICGVCRGTGFCTNCLGRKVVECPECKGKLRLEKTRQVACDRCKGTGKFTTKGFGGETVQPCPSCKGVGFFQQTYSVDCSKCGGSGTVRCPVCNGTGLCKGCGGKKRIPGCKYCGDTHSIVTVCPRCSGTGQCTQCQGWGKCGLCEGSGVCSKCGGKQLCPVMELVANSQWLRVDNGCLLQMAAPYSLGGAPLKPLDAGAAYAAVAAADCKSLRRTASGVALNPGPREVICVCEGPSREWIKNALLR